MMSRRITWILEVLFPSAPDDTMAIAEATRTAVTCGTPGPDGLICDRAKNHGDGLHADSRSGSNYSGPVTWRDPYPRRLQNVQGIHPSLHQELSDEHLAELVEEWAR